MNKALLCVVLVAAPLVIAAPNGLLGMLAATQPTTAPSTVKSHYDRFTRIQSFSIGPLKLKTTKGEAEIYLIVTAGYEEKDDRSKAPKKILVGIEAISGSAQLASLRNGDVNLLLDGEPARLKVDGYKAEIRGSGKVFESISAWIDAEMLKKMASAKLLEGEASEVEFCTTDEAAAAVRDFASMTHAR
jgi:hypothetical protein